MHTIHQSMSLPLFEVMFGRKAVLPIDVEMDIAMQSIHQ